MDNMDMDCQSPNQQAGAITPQQQQLIQLQQAQEDQQVLKLQRQTCDPLNMGPLVDGSVDWQNRLQHHTGGQVAMAAGQHGSQQLATTNNLMQPLTAFQQPAVQFTRTDYKAKSAVMNTGKVSYRTDILSAIKDTATKAHFASDLERNDRLTKTSNGKLNDLKNKIDHINGLYSSNGALNTPSQIAMSMIHESFQGQESLIRFTKQMIHPTAGSDTLKEFMRHFNELNHLTQQLMEQSFKSFKIQIERAIIVNDVKNYIKEQDKVRLAGIHALEQSVSSTTMFLEN